MLTEMLFYLFATIPALVTLAILLFREKPQPKALKKGRLKKGRR